MQKITIATLVAAAMLSACGGGGEVAEPAVQGGSTKALRGQHLLERYQPRLALRPWATR